MPRLITTSPAAAGLYSCRGLSKGGSSRTGVAVLRPSWLDGMPTGESRAVMSRVKGGRDQRYDLR